MADESPVGSPLSILSSDDFEGEEEQERLLAELERKAAEAIMPPAKRQKLGDSSKGLPPLENDGDVSSDTSGEVPNSPSNPRQEDDDAHEQVTVCAWIGCTAGDLGDMDRLVAHIHEEHIETRTNKKYTCEWSNCTRRSMNHTSGYALKAHVRSHTREKPFYCALPECDRAFTRSDALAKHMRTVHETEALRPSDPIPKSMHPAARAARLKLAVKPSPNPVEGIPALNGFTNGSDPPGWTSSYPSELGFTAEEEARGPQELFRLLRRQVHWAEEEGDLLKRQCEAMEETRRMEWLEKEVLLHQVINNEMDWHRRREEVLAGKGPSVDEIKAAAAAALSPPAMASSPPAMQSSGQPGERDAAAVLSSIHQV